MQTLWIIHNRLSPPSNFHPFSLFCTAELRLLHNSPTEYLPTLFSFLVLLFFFFLPRFLICLYSTGVIIKQPDRLHQQRRRVAGGLRALTRLRSQRRLKKIIKNDKKSDFLKFVFFKIRLKWFYITKDKRCLLICGWQDNQALKAMGYLIYTFQVLDDERWPLFLARLQRPSLL